MISLQKLRWLLGLMAIVLLSPTVKPQRPNVVLILMDDMGYGDLSCYGASTYSTPIIDRLAVEGTRFTNFLAAQPICTASRAALLTGCYPNRLGLSGALQSYASEGLNPEEETIAELLKEQGYRTGIFGKWHLGSKQAFMPLQQGFDEYFGIPYSNDMWPINYDGTPATTGNKARHPMLPLIDGNQKVDEISTQAGQDQLTRRLTERAVAFIDKHRRAPFFLYVPHPMPHVPIGVSERFRGKTGKGLYADMMQEVDWSVGQIMEALKRNGLDKNTLVIFTSDNGPWANFGNHAGSAGGLREGKATSFEGGNRVPFLVRWSGVVPAGRVRNELLTNLDVLPTIAQVGGARLPKKPIDGVAALALLKGEATAPRDHFVYYYQKNSLEAVRQGDWKLVFAHSSRTYEGFLPGNDGLQGNTDEKHAFPMALYDLRRDPGERYDVQKQHPDIVARLERIAERTREELGDDLVHREGKQNRAVGYNGEK